MNKKSTVITLGIIAAGVLVGLLILFGGSLSKGTEEHGHDEKTATHADSDKKPEPGKGPHGGRLLSSGSFAVEVTIFEHGVAPEFRIYPSVDGKPVPPGDVKLLLIINRLGSDPESIPFTVQKDHLRSSKPIEEPHSFAVQVAAEYQGKRHDWTYEQIEGRITMDDAAARTAGIEIATATPARIRSTLQLQGEIQFNQDRVVRVVPRLSGVITSAGTSLGDRVKRGDVLAVLESQDLGNLKGEYLAAQQRLSLARTTFDREKKMWEEKISAEQDYLARRQALSEAEIAQRNAEQKLLGLGFSREALQRQKLEGLTRLEIRAPIDGVVIEKKISAGEAVSADAGMYVIADLATVWADMTIFPADLNRVKVGQKVRVKAAALGAEADGVISHVGALIGEQSRTAKARVTLRNPEQRWRPGLFVSIDVVQDETEVAVAVPLTAIQTLREWKVVFARFGDVFEARPVELGRSDGESVEIVKGLAPGTRYAATNSFVLKADIGKAGASHDH
ncbi:MAG: efflux RND transporter periplasmic adaptor subunit [Burkholderiales bacterium]|nr:efflux RND transporter periplasmic adaptor subunit [Burkholderiales bacterium]